MSFGLTNVSSTFTTLIIEVSQPYFGKFVVMYLDGILIYSDNVGKHLYHTRLVLEALEKCYTST
jgi:hypothetical protein